MVVESHEVVSKFVTTAGWDDVPHLSEAQKRDEAARIPPYQLDARSKGIPQLGAGAIYPVPESDILVDPFVIPDWMPQSYGMDIGWKRTAVVWGAMNPDTDVLYLYAEHYMGHAEPATHAHGIRARGVWIPGVIDPAARGRAQKDGEQLLNLYRDELGLNLTVADNGVTAGLDATWLRMATGRLKVFRGLQNWLKEFRMYRRDDKGHVVKENDHLMDCTRYEVVSGIKVATIRPPSQWTTGKPRNQHQADYDPMAHAWRTPR